MSTIQDYLNKIKTAIYGKDVRQAIHDAIFKCYEDGKAGSIDLVARENINTLTNQVAAMDPENNLQKTGGTMTGDIAMNGNKITGLADPIADGDAVNLLFMNTAIADFVHSLGLGTIPAVASDLNTKAKTGWWVVGEATENKPSNITLGVVQVIARTSAQVLQIVTSTTGLRCRRVTTDYPNSWGEWEWENPPMLRDKEYRTVERFDGVPVFAQKLLLIIEGASTSGGEVTTKMADNISKFIRICGSINGIFTYPYYNIVRGSYVGLNTENDRNWLRFSYSIKSDPKLVSESDPSHFKVVCDIIVYYTKTS